MAKKIKMLILARSASEAAQYRNEHGMRPEEYPYIASYMDVLGHHDVPHVRVGDWFARHDVEQIERTLEAHQSEETTPV